MAEVSAHRPERRADVLEGLLDLGGQVAGARRLYATEGLNISMASVAREAGVGKATLSRHFTSPGELIDAAFADRMDAYVRATTEALTTEDPWWAFVDYIWTVCEMQAHDRGFADVLTLSLPGAEAFEARRAQAYAGFLKIIERAGEPDISRPASRPRTW